MTLTESPPRKSLSEDLIAAAEATLDGKSIPRQQSQLSQRTSASKYSDPTATRAVGQPATPDEDASKANAGDADAQTSDALPSSLPKQSSSHQQLPQDDSTQPLFSDFALSREVNLAVAEAGYISPTPIQAEIIPHMLAGRDVLAQSQTGTGKTAAFAVPILSQLEANASQPQVLVLTPTRELATQVAKSFETYGNCMPKLRIAAIYGGADYEPQLKLLRKGAQIVVGTPGRVIDHIQRGTLRLDALRCLVLDEADEMLNMGFLEDVQFVLQQTPAQRQIALFSATLPPPIRKIADEYLQDPAKVTIRGKTLTADSIQQRCVLVDESKKLKLLARMLEVEDTDGVIVFTKTKDATVRVAEHLSQLGISAAALNGDLPQNRRQHTVDQLKSGKLNVLVATDVAARGLDVQRISHVFNFDLPHDSESYVHRIGRTGRAGRSGVAIIFLTPRQRGKLRLMEKATRQPIEIVQPPSAEQLNAKRIERFKEQIAKASDHKQAKAYLKLIRSFAEESGKSIEQIATALAWMAQGQRPLLDDEDPNLFVTRSDTRRSGQRGKRDAEHPSGGRRPAGPPPNGFRRYRVEVGRADGIRPGNLVGAIAGETGLDSAYIGSIDIHDDFSTVDLPEGMPKDIHQTLKRTWVGGKQLKLRPWQPADTDSGSQRVSRGRRPGSGKTGTQRQHMQGSRGPFSGKSKKMRGKPTAGGNHAKPHKRKRKSK